MEKRFKFQRSSASQKKSNIDRPQRKQTSKDYAMHNYQKDQLYLESDFNGGGGSLKKTLLPQSPVPTQMNDDSSHYISKSQRDLIPHTFDLNDVIHRYGDHPEVLGLILSSKVEEDRRKAEEARLRQKELEYLILSKRDTFHEEAHSKQNEYVSSETHEPMKIISKPFHDAKDKTTQSVSDQDIAYLHSNFKECNRTSYAVKHPQVDFGDANSAHRPSDSSDNFPSSYISAQQRLLYGNRDRHHGSIKQFLSPSQSAESSTKTPSRQLQTSDFVYTKRDAGNYLPALPKSPSNENRHKSTFGRNMLPPINVPLQSHGRTQEPTCSSSIVTVNFPSSRAQPETLKSVSSLHSFGTANIDTLPSEDESYPSSESLQKERRPSVQTEKYPLGDKSPSSKEQQTSTQPDNNVDTSSSSPSKKLLLPSNHSRYAQNHVEMTNRPRRRKREMQAISMIIETREFPYNDEYIWKNNGNTTQKNTGQKSIYYKCSNSVMGCPVNKTVTFKENGEYLIKYRGNHLNDCNKIKRVVDI
ncbi:hypothetical protein BD408DRAFT_131297 [Parasitella parasitica]|nr:hypothetical protein BD408DRAFT_131297 [Parasitella parasitica]